MSILQCKLKGCHYYIHVRSSIFFPDFYRFIFKQFLPQQNIAVHTDILLLSVQHLFYILQITQLILNNSASSEKKFTGTKERANERTRYRILCFNVKIICITNACSNMIRLSKITITTLSFCYT